MLHVIDTDSMQHSLKLLFFLGRAAELKSPLPVKVKAELILNLNLNLGPISSNDVIKFQLLTFGVRVRAQKLLHTTHELLAF